ncbi:AAA family ATPase [Streptomyces sp. NPDC005388]|uniref:AAA family ATPase n=1 Tax=Streptomyces sp. NPDC005388 TaxID=3156717 RepID=UPI0033AD5C16
MTETFTSDTLATALVTAREAACLTQEDLAERSGLSVRAIRNLETGHTSRPRKQSLLLLAEALGLPSGAAEQLLGKPHTGNRHGSPHRLPPAELPAAPRHPLVGRERLIASLRALVTTRDQRDHASPAIVVGPPGSGKTSLIVQTAHGVRDQFPDGQVFVDLHPVASAPLTPDTLVRRILRSLGSVRAADNPEEAGAQLRDVLSRRHVLVVLDNADSEAQIRPLLVEDVHSAVLVAARRELPALPAQVRHQIGPLSQLDAQAVLEHLVGADRVHAEQSAALSILHSCARLPLAVHLAGLWLSARPHRSLRDLAGRLLLEQDRLRTLRVGDLSLQASMAAHHRSLPLPVQATLRQLGSVHRDFGVDDMVTQVTPSRDLAMELLDELLYRQAIHISRVDSDGQIRYRLYDAVRLYVAHCLTESPAGDGAGGRVWLPRQATSARSGG